MRAAARVIDIDVERDRKACIAIDAKIAGANRELAQWLVDHPNYSAPEVAKWLGCGVTRIKDLRLWAKRGFEGSPTKDRRQRSDNRRRAGDEDLETQENFETETGDESEQDEHVADPAVILENLRHLISRHRAGAEGIRKVIKVSRLESGAREELRRAIDSLILKWKSVLSTLAHPKRRVT